MPSYPHVEHVNTVQAAEDHLGITREHAALNDLASMFLSVSMSEEPKPKSLFTLYTCVQLPVGNLDNLNITMMFSPPGRGRGSVVLLVWATEALCHRSCCCLHT